MLEEVRSLLSVVAHARAQVATAREEVDRIKDEIAASELGQKLAKAGDVLDAYQALLRQEEARAREAIVAVYETTGDKRPVPGAGIRVLKVPRYDEEEARAWAEREAPALLVLDRKAFERADLPGAPIKWEDLVTATLATDLTDYLDDGDGDSAV